MIVKLVLPNGITMQGESTEISEMVKKLGYEKIFDPEVYHYSESKGEYIRIDSMNEQYIANAIHKILRSSALRWTYSITSAVDIANTLTEKHMFALLSAYKKLRKT